MKKNLSASLIVQDEEQYIERAILNIRDVVDEIIIVDGGSKDNTVEICKSLGCKVYHREFDFHYANQRNYALSLCNNDWVLILDADETFSKEALSLIPTLVKTGTNKKVGAYKFKIYHDSGTRPLDPTYTVRLVNKRAGVWENRLHEIFSFSEDYKMLIVPDEYCMYHKKTLNKQLFNNLLYQNIENNKFERPQDNEGLDGKQLEDGTWELFKVINDRNA